MLQITGKIISVHPVNEGVSQQSGKAWKRGGFSIETEGEYPKKVAFTLFGDEKLGWLANYPIGTHVIVDFNPESREYQEHWYTDLQCVRISPVTAQQPQQPAQQMTPQQATQQFYQTPPTAQPTAAMPTQQGESDLPF